MKEKVGFIILLLTRAAVTSTDLPEGKNNPCPPPDNPNMVQCPNTTIEGKVGDTVILPCSTKNEMNISYDQVEWLIKDPTTGEYKDVHFYHQCEDQLYKQSDDFKNRTSLFKDQLSSGNCSLRLLVTTSHSGTYYCCVGGHLYCTVTLKGLPKGKDASPNRDEPNKDIPCPPPDNPNNGTDGLTTTQKVGLGVGIPAALLLIVIAYVAYRYREQLMNCCQQGQPNNPPINLGVLDQAEQPPQNQENEPEDQNPNEERSPMLGNEDQDHPADCNEPAADN